VRDRRALARELPWLLVPALSSSLCVRSSAARLGATFDEPFYLRAGLEGWRALSHGELLNEGVMPLPIDVQTLPLRLAELARGRPFDLACVRDCLDFVTLLSWARSFNLAFWWLLLLAAWLLGRRWGGVWGGRLAVLWLAFEPNLLAHAALATTDIAVTAMLLLLCWGAEVSRPWSPRRRVALLALLYGLALAAKASALLYGPALLVALQLAHGWRSAQPGDTQPGDAQPARRSAAWRSFPARFGSSLERLPRELPWIVLGGLGFALIHGGTDGRVEASFVEWTRSLPPSALAGALTWTAESLRVFPNAGEAIVKQIGHNVRGHGAFLLGRVWPRAFWLYFPVALTIKLTLPYLVAAVALLAAHARAAVRARGVARSLPGTPGSLPRNPALWATAALLLLSLTSRVQIGVRLVLPLVALLGVAAAVGGARLIGADGRWRLPARWGVGAATAWIGVASLAVWPHALTFANPLWGGSERGFLRLSDSNHDWGQGLPELRRWAERHDEPELWVWYFGTDPTLAEAPFRSWPGGAVPLDPDAAFAGKLVAVGTTVLHGAYDLGRPVSGQTASGHPANGHPAIAVLRSRAPSARTTTFLIYDFRAQAP
jgi:hypothetical protein